MTSIHERVELARAGKNPTVICPMPSGWAVIGDDQFLEGYCLLIADPVVDHLTDLDDAGRARFLSDLTMLGEALLAVTDAVRINYDILGNSDPALHAHVFARYANEPEYQRRRTVWHYDDATRTSVPLDLSKHEPLRARLSEYLTARLDGSAAE